MTFGQKCRKYRQLVKLTQQQTAQAAGISLRTYVYYEKDKKLPRKKETVQKLAAVFGTDPNLLIVEDDERFLQLMAERPAQDRIKSIVSDIALFIGKEKVDVQSKDELAAALDRLCTEYRSRNIIFKEEKESTLTDDSV